MADVMITVKDNPYSPFTQYKEWWNWDFVNGYHTESRLAAYDTGTNAYQSDFEYENDVLVAMFRMVSDFPDIYEVVSAPEETHRGEGA